ncbi:MAG: hypothetical protein J2P46_04360 [Zavarzinella sp.]|nr:hypothetical protein [Zavarzinella sp.]
MMGPKKLSEIREELRRHFAKDGKDPTNRLKELKGEVPEATRLIESLQRFIDGVREPRRRPKPRKPRPAKKR